MLDKIKKNKKIILILASLNYSSSLEEQTLFGRYAEQKVLWYGEASSVFVASQSLGELFKLLSYNVHPPFYYLNLHYWIKIFGPGEIATSFLSIIFNLLSIIAIYFLAKQLFTKKIAILSSIVFALMPLQILFATRVTEQSLTLLLAILSTLFFAKNINHLNKKNSIFYIVFSILMIYTSYPAFFFWLSHMLYLLYHHFTKVKIDLKKWFFIQSLVVVLFIPQLLAIKSWAFFSGYEGLLHFQRRFDQSLFLSFFYLPQDLIAINSTDLNFIFNLFFWLFVTIFLIKDVKKQPSSKFIVFLLATTVILLFILKFHNTIRYFIVISFLWYFILTIASYKKKVVYVLLIIFLLFLNFKSFLIVQSAEDYGRDFSKYIKNNEKNNDIIIGDQVMLSYYYQNKENGKLPIYWFQGIPDNFEDDIYSKILFFGYNTVKPDRLKQLADNIKPYERIWFIQSRDLSLNDPNDYTRQWLMSNLELVDLYPATTEGVTNYYDAYIFLFKNTYAY